MITEVPPAEGGRRPDSPARRVDAACDRFEAAWRGGLDPRIEDVLDAAAAVERPALLRALIVLELELRRGRGEPVDPQEYQERFPKDREVINEALEASSSSGSASESARGTSGARLLETDPAPDPGPISPEGSGLADSAPGAGGNLGSYQLLEYLGQGGMGRVYKARHRWLKRIVALKVIREEFADDADAIQRFRREVEAVGQLAHPNIVLAFDADVVDGKHFLVMEYVDGINLLRMVQESGPLPVTAACDCIRQAALGLRHVHEHALVHRDIKPANLLITQGSVVKVADLGLARLHESGPLARTLTQDGSLIGTPDYLAPEQADKPHLADIRADIYSLGCTFYYLLTGRPPFPGGSYPEKLIRHRECEPEPIQRHRADMPPAVGQIVRKMMAKRPEDRYQAPDEVVAAIGPYCQDPGPRPEERSWPGVITREPPLELGEPARAPSTRHGPFASRRLVGTGTVCLAGSMLAGLLLLRGSARIPSPPGPDSPHNQALSDRDVTADVRKIIVDQHYYKLSGLAGLRYFVVGTDVVLDHARRKGDALTITLQVKESHRGIGLRNLDGLAELEFTPNGGKAEVTRITDDDQIVNFDSSGTLAVQIQDVKSLAKPVESKPPPRPGAGPPSSGTRAQERDATADVRKIIVHDYYYKLSGPAGLRYFVVGTDVVLDHARREGDALTITLQVKEGHRGIELLYLNGLAELEFTPEGGRARVIKIADDHQVANFDSPGTLAVKIQDVKKLGSNWSTDPR
jgi:serine/threonine protein kinase